MGLSLLQTLKDSLPLHFKHALLIDRNKLTEVIERLPTCRKQVVPRSNLVLPVCITVSRKIIVVVHVEVPLDLQEPTSAHHLSVMQLTLEKVANKHEKIPK